MEKKRVSMRVHVCIRPCGLMDKALVFGTKDCRFESCQGHSPSFTEEEKVHEHEQKHKNEQRLLSVSSCPRGGIGTDHFAAACSFLLLHAQARRWRAPGGALPREARGGTEGAGTSTTW